MVTGCGLIMDTGKWQPTEKDITCSRKGCARPTKIIRPL